MSCYAKKVVETAMLEIGYKETGTNHNKYAEYIDKNYPNFYNGPKSWAGGGAEWCDIFVDYCILVNSADMNEALYVTCQPSKSCGAGCSFSYDYYKKQGRVGNNPKIGAQIFFGTGKKPTHTGIVVDFYGDSVVTVEGNSDNMTKRHTYKQSSSRIFGYGYPRYTEEAPQPAPAPDPQPQPTPAPTPAPAPSGELYKVKTNGSNLRLRVAPNANAAVLALMPNGSKVTVSGTNGGWSRTTYKGNTGWAYSKWLTKI